MNINMIHSCPHTRQEIILAALEHLKKHGPYSEKNGICAHVQKYCARNVDVEMSTKYQREIISHTMNHALCYDMAEIWTAWPKYSGNKQYPVPHTECEERYWPGRSHVLIHSGNFTSQSHGRAKEHAAYHAALTAFSRPSQVDKWDKDTQYGADRWELVDFMIEKLQARIEE